MSRPKNCCHIRTDKKDAFKNQSFDFYLKIWKLADPGYSVRVGDIKVNDAAAKAILYETAKITDEKNPSEVLLNWELIIKLYFNFVKAKNSNNLLSFEQVDAAFKKDLWQCFCYDLDAKRGFSEKNIKKHLCKNKDHKDGSSEKIGKDFLEKACKAANLNFYEVVDLSSLSINFYEHRRKPSKNARKESLFLNSSIDKIEDLISNTEACIKLSEVSSNPTIIDSLKKYSEELDLTLEHIEISNKRANLNIFKGVYTQYKTRLLHHSGFTKVKLGLIKEGYEALLKSIEYNSYEEDILRKYAIDSRNIALRVASLIDTVDTRKKAPELIKELAKFKLTDDEHQFDVVTQAAMWLDYYHSPLSVHELITYVEDGKYMRKNSQEVKRIKEDSKSTNARVTYRHVFGKMFINDNPFVAKQKFEEQLSLILEEDPEPRFNALGHIYLRISDCNINLKQYDEAERNSCLAEEFFDCSFSSMGKIDKVYALSRKAKIAIFRGNRIDADKYIIEARNIIGSYKDFVKRNKGKKEISKILKIYNFAFN